MRHHNVITASISRCTRPTASRRERQFGIELMPGDGLLLDGPAGARSRTWHGKFGVGCAIVLA